MSENDIIKKLEERYKKGEISKETYESIMKEYRKEQEEEEKDEAEDEKISGGVSIAGSGKVDGVKGEYLRIAGSGKVEGNVNVKDVSVSGSAKIEGDVIADNLKSSGGCRIEGDLRAKRVWSAGGIHVEGTTESESITTAGSGKFEGDVRTGVLRSDGGTRCEGKIHAEKEIEMGGALYAHSVETGEFFGRGGIKVEKGVKTKKFKLEMNGNSSVGSIESDEIEILSASSKGIISRIFGKGGSMKAKRIKGKTVHIENTVADVVEGENVNIGPGCRVKILKAEKAQVHESSSVTKRERKEE